MKRGVVPGLLLISVTVGAVLLSTHFRSNSAEASCSNSTAALTAAVQRLIDNDNVKNLEGVVAGYTDDAVLLPPKAATVTGKVAIRSNYEHLFSGSTLKLSIKVVEARAVGDLGFVRGFTEGTVTPGPGLPPNVVNDKFLGLVRCQAGEWRVSHLMWSPEISTP